MPRDPANSLPSPADSPAGEPPLPLCDSDRAILRALLDLHDRPLPRTEPTDPGTSSLLLALAAAGLDDLDLPLWFAQPHIQDYITAHRALEDFLDDQASRAAQRQGLELLRSLAHTTDSDATCHDPCRPHHSPASPSPNPHPTTTPTQQRLIATALLRAPRAPRQRPSEIAAQRAAQTSGQQARHRTPRAPHPAPVPGPETTITNHALEPTANHALEPSAAPTSRIQPNTTARPTRPRIESPSTRPDTQTPSPAAPPRTEQSPAPSALSPDDPEELLPEDADDASFDQALQWAISLLSSHAPNPATPHAPTPPDTS